MKAVVYFVACCLCFGSAFGSKASNHPDNHSFVIDPVRVFLDLPPGWVAEDNLTGTMQEALPKDMPSGPPVVFGLAKEDEENELYELAVVAFFPCGDEETAREAITELKTYFPPKKSFADGFNARFGPLRIACRAYGPNVAFIWYAADKENKNSKATWKQLQKMVVLSPLSSFEEGEL